jgi:predicted TPR repeat methyltransferase
MTDLFEEKAAEWDTRPLPQQISQGVGEAIAAHVDLSRARTALDFGAGTGLVASRIAPHVERVVAVDISAAMLEVLAAKPELEGKVDTRCQDILDEPLGERVDLIVSAMALHHVEPTRRLLEALHQHLEPGGSIALADLDTEPGDFHPPDTPGVYHFGFDREALGQLAREVGFQDVSFDTACEIVKDDRPYSIFLLTATRPA